MDASNHPRLRLAARTLVEWKTPVQSDDYQAVLGDLVSTHAVSAAQIVASRSDILYWDDQGSFLSYLAHTPRINTSAYAASTSWYITALLGRLRIFEVLYDYLDIPYEKTADRFKLSETILAAIDSTDEELSVLGHKVLIAVGMRLEAHVREALIRELYEAVALESLPLVRKLSRWVRDDDGRHILEGLIILLVTSIGAVGYFSMVTPEARDQPSLLNLIVGFSGISVVIPIIFFERYLKNSSKIGILGNMALDAGFIKSWLARLKLPYADISADKLIKAMGDLAGKHKTVLYRLAIERSETDWLQFALESTPAAKPEIIREALYLLRLPEVKERQRGAIVNWLARVQIL